MMRIACLLGSFVLAACSPSGSSDGTLHSCAEAAAALPGHTPPCPLTSGCATEFACDGWSGSCSAELGGCERNVLACVEGRVRAFDTADDRCDASAGLDAGVRIDANVDAAVIVTPPDDAGGVHSCEAAWAMIGPHPCLSSGLDCDAGFVCDGFDSCLVCPNVIECDHRQVTIRESPSPCDAGP